MPQLPRRRRMLSTVRPCRSRAVIVARATPLLASNALKYRIPRPPLFTTLVRYTEQAGPRVSMPRASASSCSRFPALSVER